MREAELEVYRKQAANEGKPEDMLDKIAEGRLRKWYEEVVLLEQPYFRDEKLTVEEVRAALAHETGENIEIARFASLRASAASRPDRRTRRGVGARVRLTALHSPWCPSARHPPLHHGSRPSTACC